MVGMCAWTERLRRWISNEMQIIVRLLKRSFGWVMEPERVIYRLILLLMLFGTAYFCYCLYYANLRLQINKWNERPAKKIDHLYNTDPVLKAIHERMMAKSMIMSSEITLVTAYFNLGKLNKGRKFGIGPGYTPEKYKRWMSVFGRLDNPLVVFTDSHDVADMFAEMRAHFGEDRTKIIRMNRTELYSFSLAPRIKEVFSQPGYPAYDPNTVNENYSCVMHAKFELVAKVIREEMFQTRYVSWLDIGLFRAVVNEQYVFPVRLPQGFDPDKVAYSGQTVFDSSLSPYQIIVEDKAWVGGAMFLGRPEVLYVYTQDYLHAVEKLLSEGMMSTDQQVIYIMYQPIFPVKPRVEIQTYTTFSTDDWFYLGYTIKESWDYHLRKAVSMLKILQYIL